MKDDDECLHRYLHIGDGERNVWHVPSGGRESTCICVGMGLQEVRQNDLSGALCISQNGHC